MEHDASREQSVGGPDFGGLYREHHPAMLRMVIGLLPRAEAEAVVHDVLADLWMRPGRYDAARGGLRPYLMMAARGRALDHLRSTSRRHGREERAGVLELRAEVDHDGTREELRDALANLPEDERLPIVHAFFAGRTYAEVAVAIGEPEGTVKSRIRRGLRRLREALVDDPGPAVLAGSAELGGGTPTSVLG